jgi:hypothetical protein
MGRRSIITPNKCDNRGYKADYVESLVWEQVKEILNQPELVLTGLKAQQEESNKVSALQRNLETIEIQLTNRLRQKDRIYRAFYLTGDEGKFKADMTMLVDEINVLEKRRQELESRINSCTASKANVEAIKRACELVKHNLKGLSFSGKRLALEALQIELHTDGDNMSLHGAVPIGEVASTPAC